MFPSYDNHTVQTKLANAVSHLDALPSQNDGYDASKTFLRELLNLYRLFSASSNSIAGLGGLGREEAVVLADRVTDGEFDKRINVQFNKKLLSGF